MFSCFNPSSPACLLARGACLGAFHGEGIGDSRSGSVSIYLFSERGASTFLPRPGQRLVISSAPVSRIQDVS